MIAWRQIARRRGSIRTNNKKMAALELREVFPVPVKESRENLRFNLALLQRLRRAADYKRRQGNQGKP